MEIESGQQELIFENAKISEADQLTELTIRSKNHWNYGEDQLKEWQDALTISTEYIQANEVVVLKRNQEIIGYYSYFYLEEFQVELDNMFIDPSYIGQGFGGSLINHFLERIKGSEAVKVILYSDPHAENFYKKYGFKVVGQLESSQKDRFLPIMERVVDSGEKEWNS